MEGGRIYVLFVEDNAADAELLSEAFGEVCPDAECTVVSTPAACCEALDEGEWDLVLMDLRLGPHDGHDLLERLAGDGTLETLRLYVLSSSGAPHDIERALRHPIHGYLRKPFTIDGWLQLARELVPRSSPRE